MSKPASSSTDLIALGAKKSEWRTETLWVTIEMSTDIGTGDNDDNAARIVCTQLSTGLNHRQCNVGEENIPAAMKIR